jgi:transposase
VSVAAIRRRARVVGVQAGPRQVGEETVGLIVELYGQGVRIVEIGKRVGFGHRRVRQVLTDAGVQIHPRGRRPAEGRRDEVVRLRDQGWSYARIGRHLGVSPSTLQGLMKRWQTTINRAEALPD